MQRASVLRLIDANANRALEGLRVCEDAMRLHFSAADPSRRLRKLRHDAAEALRRLGVPRCELLSCRESRKDVGRAAGTSRTKSIEEMLVINFQRAKEALRVLEESSRILSPRTAGRFQALRFRAYTLERETLLYVAALRHS